MRIVFAAPSAAYKRLIECKVQNYLASQYNSSDIKTIILIATELNKESIKPTVIIDSGAFSAWNKGKEVSIEKYLHFIMNFQRLYKHLFSEIHFVNLDVIPGQRGQGITFEMTEQSAKQGLDNYLYFKDKGIETIHVYHQGEDVKWLKEMIRLGMKYIGISPSNEEGTPARCNWLEYVFKFVPEDVKVHGFAVTSPRLMLRYPWFSVDSATYNFLAAMGGFIFCKPEGLEYHCYHYSERLNDLPRNEIQRQYLQDLLYKIDNTFNLDEIKNSKSHLRVKINIKTFLELEKRINETGHTNKHLQQADLFM